MVLPTLSGQVTFDLYNKSNFKSGGEFRVGTFLISRWTPMMNGKYISITQGVICRTFDTCDEAYQSSFEDTLDFIKKFNYPIS